MERERPISRSAFFRPSSSCYGRCRPDLAPGLEGCFGRFLCHWGIPLHRGRIVVLVFATLARAVGHASDRRARDPSPGGRLRAVRTAYARRRPPLWAIRSWADVAGGGQDGPNGATVARQTRQARTPVPRIAAAADRHGRVRQRG